jgi:hypothetical protein
MLQLGPQFAKIAPLGSTVSVPSLRRARGAQQDTRVLDLGCVPCVARANTTASAQHPSVCLAQLGISNHLWPRALALTALQERCGR